MMSDIYIKDKQLNKKVRKQYDIKGLSSHIKAFNELKKKKGEMPSIDLNLLKTKLKKIRQRN